MGMPVKPSFRVGDAVVVKSGVLCPDKPTVSLAGWQGWVTELYPAEGTLAFKWDSPTMRSIPDDYIRECEIEGLGWESMVLGADEVLPATPRDTPAEADAVYEAIMTHHHWDHLADLNPGISDLLGPLGKADSLTYLHAWEEHLGQVLRFPFEARVEEQLRRGPVQVGDIVQILGIADVDDLYGLLVNVRLDRRSYTLPLCDLEATDHTSANYQPLKDYVIWFANR
jgi:hypothetical protein